MRRHLTVLLLVLCCVVGAKADTTSTTRVWFPGPPTGGDACSFPSANVLRCAAWVPPEAITNATSITWYLTGGQGGGALCSITFYDATGSAQIRTSGAQNCASTGVVAATGLTAFSLAAGAKVQVCICGSVSGGSYLGTQPGASSALEALQNGLSVPILTTAANACVAGVAPATTGVLSATNAGSPIGLLGTNTP